MKQILVFGVMLFFHGCLNSQSVPFESYKTFEVPTELLEGKIDLIDSTQIELKDFSAGPLLLVFASETCSICREETIAFKAEFEKFENLKVITLIVGSIKEDAEDWSSADNWEDESAVPWSVGFEFEPHLFSKYCPNSSAPCSLLQLPKQGVVLKRIGKLEPAEVLEVLSEQN